MGGCTGASEQECTKQNTEQGALSSYYLFRGGWSSLPKQIFVDFSFLWELRRIIRKGYQKVPSLLSHQAAAPTSVCWIFSSSLLFSSISCSVSSIEDCVDVYRFDMNKVYCLQLFVYSLVIFFSPPPAMGFGSAPTSCQADNLFHSILRKSRQNRSLEE